LLTEGGYDSASKWREGLRERGSFKLNYKLLTELMEKAQKLATLLEGAPKFEFPI